jgi:hypothetical protein
MTDCKQQLIPVTSAKFNIADPKFCQLVYLLKCIKPRFLREASLLIGELTYHVSINYLQGDTGNQIGTVITIIIWLSQKPPYRKMLTKMAWISWEQDRFQMRQNGRDSIPTLFMVNLTHSRGVVRRSVLEGAVPNDKFHEKASLVKEANVEEDFHFFRHCPTNLRLRSFRPTFPKIKCVGRHIWISWGMIGISLGS